MEKQRTISINQRELSAEEGNMRLSVTSKLDDALWPVYNSVWTPLDRTRLIQVCNDCFRQIKNNVQFLVGSIVQPQFRVP